MWKLPVDCNKQLGMTSLLSFIGTTALGKLARELAKLLVEKMNCWHAGCFLLPPRIKSTLGRQFTTWACALEELFQLSRLFIWRKIVSLVAETLLVTTRPVELRFHGMEKQSENTDLGPLRGHNLNITAPFFFITSSSSWPSRLPSRHLSTSHLHYSTFFQVFCFKVTMHSQRSLTTLSQFVSAAFRLFLQHLLGCSWNTHVSPQLLKAFGAGLSWTPQANWLCLSRNKTRKQVVLKRRRRSFEEDQEEWRQWLMSCCGGHSIHVAAVLCLHLRGPIMSTFRLRWFILMIYLRTIKKSCLNKSFKMNHSKLACCF